jgi:cation transporter-like permease
MSALRRHRDGIFAAFCLLVLVITAIWPEVTGLDPDNGNGAVEWLFLGVLGLLFLIFAVRARRAFRAARETS